MDCTVSAIGDLPVRRSGLFQAEQTSFTGDQLPQDSGNPGVWETKIASLGLSGNGKSR
jgi:hypothetical protein